jgi:hypothetical protein
VVSVAGDGEVPHPTVPVGRDCAAVGIGDAAAGGLERFALPELRGFDPCAGRPGPRRGGCWWYEMVSVPCVVMTVRSYRSVSYLTSTARVPVVRLYSVRDEPPCRRNLAL